MNYDYTYDKRSLFTELKEELLLHAKSEHVNFYKALKLNPETKKIVQHAEVKEYLDKITDCPIDDDRLTNRE